MSLSSPSEKMTAGGSDLVVPAETAQELYEHAPCGYLSTLPDGTIVNVNETLLSWLGYRRDELVGHRRFVDLLSAGGRIYHETHYAPLLMMQGTVREIAFDIVCADGRRLPVLLNAVLVRTAEGLQVIRVSVFDATDRREYERELLRARQQAERAEARARSLAETLQSSLIPPSPPAIPGVDVAAAYRPAGAGDEVGGDFYDVFSTGEDDWAVVVGDVCGKGAAAAAVTALARYTVRAAAMRTRRPSAVLGTLNSALLRDATERFCTVVYARVRRDLRGGLKVTLASAGHVSPVRIGKDGVEFVSTTGTLLGVVDEPALSDTTLLLDPGEALFCYTDGLTEGRRGDEFFGDQRLEATLASLRGRPGADVTGTVIEEVVRFQGGTTRDDIAAVFVGAPQPEPT